MKKFNRILMATAVAASMCMAVVNVGAEEEKTEIEAENEVQLAADVAEESEPVPGVMLTMNNDRGNFNELFCVENGKMYVPIRLAFPGLNDRENKMGLSIGWKDEGDGDAIVQIIYGPTNGGSYVKKGKATVPPFEGVRKTVTIYIDKNADNDAKYKMIYREYTLDKADRNSVSKRRTMTLENPVYIKDVTGGSRVFISIDDVKTISEYLGISDEYSVKIYDYEE